MVVFATGAMTTACSDWDDHYDVSSAVEGSATATLWENIQSNSNLSQFAALLKKTNYDKVLDSDQTYTVWAPLNGTFDYDALSSLGDDKLVREFVQNHIARNNYPASGAVDERILMLNEKVLNFEGSGQYTMSGVGVAQPNVASANGVLHTINNKLEFLASIYESLDASQFAIDSVANYFHQFDERVLNESKSIKGSVVNGEITYLDSVFDEDNSRFILYRALINKEDSNYTMIVPTNKAWAKAKELISPYFNYVDNFKFAENANTSNPVDVQIDGTYLRDSLIHLTLMRSLFFNNNLFDNGALKTLADGQRLVVDSLVNTSYRKLYAEDAANLFEGTTRVDKSNGAIFVTDSLRLHPWSFWNPMISVEAEVSSNIAALSGTRSINQITAGTQNPEIQGHVSNNAYLEARPATASGNPTINLYLPNVLSTKYRIYGVFVPSDITNRYATDTLGNSIRVQLIYNNEQGTIPRAPLLLSNITTNPNKIDTVALGEFEFPIAYYGTGDYSPILRLTGTVSGRDVDEEGNPLYSRVIRLDCILLVPEDLDNYMKEHPDYVYPDYTGGTVYIY